MNPLKVEILGHSSLIVSAGDSKFIFQPYFRKRCLWAKRAKPANYEDKNFSGFETIVYSNPKCDRFDVDGLRFFAQQKSKIFGPKSLRSTLKRHFRFEFEALKKNQEFQIGDLKIKAIKSRNKSFRFWGFHFESFHFVVECGDSKILLLSDAAYSKNLIETLRQEGPFDGLLLPIQSFAPGWMRRKNVFSPAQVCEAVVDLDIETVVPYGYGIYPFGDSNPLKPKVELEKESAKTGLLNVFTYLEAGDSHTFEPKSDEARPQLDLVQSQ